MAYVSEAQLAAQRKAATGSSISQATINRQKAGLIPSPKPVTTAPQTSGGLSGMISGLANGISSLSKAASPIMGPMSPIAPVVSSIANSAAKTIAPTATSPAFDSQMMSQQIASMKANNQANVTPMTNPLAQSGTNKAVTQVNTYNAPKPDNSGNTTQPAFNPSMDYGAAIDQALSSGKTLSDPSVQALVQARNAKISAAPSGTYDNTTIHQYDAPAQPQAPVQPQAPAQPDYGSMIDQALASGKSYSDPSVQDLIQKRNAKIASAPAGTYDYNTTHQYDTPLVEFAKQNGLIPSYDQATNTVTLTDPNNGGRALTFQNGGGQMYGLGGNINGNNVVTDTSKLMQYFKPQDNGNGAKPVDPNELIKDKVLNNPFDGQITPEVLGGILASIQNAQQPNVPNPFANTVNGVPIATPQNLQNIISQVNSSMQPFTDSQKAIYGEALTKSIQGANADSEARGLGSSDFAANRIDQIKRQNAQDLSATIADQQNKALTDAINYANVGVQEQKNLESGYEGRQQLGIDQFKNILTQLGLSADAINQFEQGYIGRINAGNALTNTEINKQNTVADQTGYMGNNPTLKNIIDTAGVSGYMGGQPTLARDQMNNSNELQAGQLTGNYKGHQTVQQQQVTLQALQTQLDTAVQRTTLLGRVGTQEDADFLGVPVGTPSQAAIQAAQTIAADLQKAQISAGATLGAAQIGASARNTLSPGDMLNMLTLQDYLKNKGQQDAVANISNTQGVSPETAQMIVNLTQNNKNSKAAWDTIMGSDFAKNNPKVNQAAVQQAVQQAFGNRPTSNVHDDPAWYQRQFNVASQAILPPGASKPVSYEQAMKTYTDWSKQFSGVGGDALKWNLNFFQGIDPSGVKAVIDDYYGK